MSDLHLSPVAPRPGERTDVRVQVTPFHRQAVDPDENAKQKAIELAREWRSEREDSRKLCERDNCDCVRFTRKAYKCVRAARREVISTLVVELLDRFGVPGWRRA